MSMDAEIDALYGTPRRRAVAKALAPRLPGESARGLLVLAQAALLAVDEDINEQELTGQLVGGTALTVGQQIRMAAVAAVAQVADPHDGTLSQMVEDTLDYAECIAAYIRDGKVGS